MPRQFRKFLIFLYFSRSTKSGKLHKVKNKANRTLPKFNDTNFDTNFWSLFSTYPKRGFHPLTTGTPNKQSMLASMEFPQLPGNFQKCIGNCRNAIQKTAHNSVVVGIGGEGVEPPVRANLRPAQAMVALRLGQPIFQNLNIVKKYHFLQMPQQFRKIHAFPEIPDFHKSL